MKLRGKRNAPRKSVAMRAVVSDRNYFISLPCTIRDASNSGCRITAQDLMLLPNKIYVKMENLSAPLKGRIVWRRRNEAGVEIQWKATRSDSRARKKRSTKKATRTIAMLDDL